MERNEISRFTLDLPKHEHKKLKTIASICGKSMREVIVEALNIYYKELESPYSKGDMPNEETKQAIADIDEALADIKVGKKPKKAKEFITWEEFLADLGM